MSSMKFLYPRVKPEHSPIRVAGNRIRIGGSVYGVGSEIVDETGAIWALLTAMDGTRTVDEIISDVRARYPEEIQSAIGAAIDSLTAAGHVDDGGADGTALAPAPPNVLTHAERDRYDRSRRFFRWIDPTPRANWWEPQLRLREASVTIVGLGGSGGHTALALAASGVGRLRCVDRDIVELSNLNRQVLYTERDVGLGKVAAAIRRLRTLNSDIEISGVELAIRGEADLRPLAETCDVLVLAADQPAEIRVWANRACHAAATPWINAGYEGPKAMTSVFLPGKGPCYECLRLTELDAERPIPQEPSRVAGTESPVAPPQASMAATAGVSGNLAAFLVVALITGTTPIHPGTAFGVNVIAPDQHLFVAGQRHPDCPTCSAS